MATKKKVAKRAKKKTPTYRSGFEKKVVAYLRKNNVDFKYESQKIKYTVPKSEHIYTPDFELPNGILVEAKGKLDRLTRKKMLLVVDQNPDKDIRFVFMRDNYIAKGSKTKYSAWAIKHGIKYHVSSEGHVPMEWLEEE